MGNWKIEIYGCGPHHNGKPEDAEVLGGGLVRALRLNGHEVSSAELLVDGSGTRLGAALAEDEPLDPIMQFFAYEHLPPHLKAVSAIFGELAKTVVATLPRNAERTVTLRKILEAKDAAVRAKLAK